MTLLFIRFYLGVIAILLIALGIMAFAFQYRVDVNFDTVTEKAMKGGVRQARESLEENPNEQPAFVLKSLQPKFDYPIRIITDDQIPVAVREWLSQDDDVVVHVNNELSVLTRLDNNAGIVWFGPVMHANGKIETDMLLAVTVVLLLVAIAIAILLRPLARQLSVLENTAISIADGDLGARVDLEQTDSAKTLALAFNGMATRVETLLRTQRELLQAVSHELRTPLARISFAIDLIRSARDDAERETRLKSLDTASQDLNELVDELMQYVRLETSTPTLSREQIDLLPVVEELIEKISLTNNQLAFSIGSGLARGGVILDADRTSFLRVLSNLLTNASRFARQEILIDATSSSTGTTITIDDDGPGIPEQDRQRVFAPFVRLEENNHGVGLGLALVERIVTNHGGIVTASTSPLGGCRIQITFMKPE